MNETTLEAPPASAEEAPLAHPILEKYGGDPLKAFEALEHAQREIGRQANEVGELRKVNVALLAGPAMKRRKKTRGRPFVQPDSSPSPWLERRGGGPSEMTLRLEEARDLAPTTTFCVHCPGWRFDGPAAEAREAFRAHQAEAHARPAGNHEERSEGPKEARRARTSLEALNGAA